VKAAFDQLTESNKLSGLVVDLRFADGDDYAAAVAVASLFLADEVPLLNWGEGLKRSQAREDAILLPVATLVNAKTGEAAEALAAMMRQSGVALVIGSRTSGTAGIMESFPLSTGQELRVTVANVQLGDAKSLDTDGVQPDVEVPVSLADEERFVADPSYTPRSQPLTATDANGETNALNAARRSRTDEAELVRRWRGEAPTATGENADSAAETEQIRDPVLLRALDLMEGLAILRSWQR
jgi:carboxyl-terminal processing protease